MGTTTTTEDDVADKNKRNEKLKVEKVQRPSSKISSLIQEAENKAKSKKTSLENLNLLKRESPLGGEDKKADDLADAPKLPPKPGFPIPTTPSFDPNNNDILDSNGGLKHERSE